LFEYIFVGLKELKRQLVSFAKDEALIADINLKEPVCAVALCGDYPVVVHIENLTAPLIFAFADPTLDVGRNRLADMSALKNGTARGKTPLIFSHD
jgi:hypothetical protein